LLEDRTLLNGYTVTSLFDSGPGSLRQAIHDADQAGGDNTITFAVTGTITVQTALPDLSTNVTMQGPGPSTLTVRRSPAAGTPAFSILTVDGSATVTVSGLTLGNGSALYGGGIFNDGSTLTVSNCFVVGNSAWRGGGILNFGTLTVRDCTVSNNSASNDGGGIANFGPLTLSNSSLTGNSAGDGGAIYNFYEARLAITYCTLSGNSAAFGGAIMNNGAGVDLGNSAVTSNSAQVGGGLFNAYAGTGTVTDCTFAGNSATYTGSGGGGVYNESGATLTVMGSTFASNSAATGGGIDNAGTLAARNTILAGNTAATGADLDGDLGSQGHNLVGDTAGGSGFAASDLRNVNPLLGPLQDNGGPTQTMALLPGSPAVDAGDNSGAPATDQRGLPRIVAGTIDIGAFEVQIGAATRLVLSAPAGAHPGVPFTITVTARDAYGHDATGTLTYAATAQSLAYVLTQQTGPLTYASAYDNWGGRGEKWLQAGGGQWYFILPSGELYRWDGSSQASGTLLGNVGASYYSDPTRLSNPPANEPHAALSVSGNTVAITPDLSWISGLVVTVTASDGLTASATVEVT
jgi:hypothetical protein